MGTDEYRQRAAEAQRKADRAKNELDREAWLKVAQGWLSLLTMPSKTLVDLFNEELADKGTGQDENESQN